MEIEQLDTGNGEVFFYGVIMAGKNDKAAARRYRKLHISYLRISLALQYIKSFLIFMNAALNEFVLDIF